jgi:polyhydroxyalkanoate depolymerase
MFYRFYQANDDLLNPARIFARTALAALTPRLSIDFRAARSLAAAYELIARAGLTHERPPYGISSVRSGNGEVAVREVTILDLPFGSLLNFRKDIVTGQAPVLVVAPLSGHFATLLRNTVKTLLSDHDVYITDWKNARDIPTDAGRFGFDDYIAYLIKFLEALGPEAHVVAVCQPCVQVLAAVSVMAQSQSASQPRSMTLMAGPVDTRINPTKVNQLATSKPIEWFERNLIARVPRRYPGAGRRVYPGFVQLSAFMSMNLNRHVQAHLDLFNHLVEGEIEKARVIKDFYDEYFAVLDLPAEFYLETVSWVFQEARLAKGELTYKGERVEPAAVRKTALLTVEGERDDICSLGQTAVALDMCRSLKPFKKRHHMQAGVGHYGVFSGRRWEHQIYPNVRNLILATG